MKSDWDATLGAGLAVGPAYEGSKHYSALPIPLVAITENSKGDQEHLLPELLNKAPDDKRVGRISCPG